MSTGGYQPSVNLDILAESGAPAASAPPADSPSSWQDATPLGAASPALTQSPVWSGSSQPYGPAAAGEDYNGNGPCGDVATTADVPDDDSLYGPATTVTTAAAPLLASDPTRLYVNSVVSNIAVSMPAFDGTTNALRMCPGATVETNPDVKPPAGTEEFSMAWFGIARAIFSVVLKQETAEKTTLRASVGSDGATPLPLSVKEVRRAFASGLHSIFHDVIGPGGSSSFRRYAANRFAYAGEVEAVSKRMMEEWLGRGELPDQLQGRYKELAATMTGTGTPTATDDLAVQSVPDLELILSVDADAWVASFFPLYQHLKRDGVGKIKPIWADIATLKDINKEELAYQIYALCNLQCLLKNKDGRTRGVAVPRDWLQRLCDWLVAVNSPISPTAMAAVASPHWAQPPTHSSSGAGGLASGNEEKESEDAAAKEAVFTKVLLSCPGPMDTFHTMHVVPGNPGKHWMRNEDRAKVDVVPERLFDYLCLLFGSGPRYLTYGEFTLHGAFDAALKPRPLRVAVTFKWDKERKEGETRNEANITGYVEDAVRRSDLAEVCRIAVQQERENDEDPMPADQLELFAAAVYGVNTLKITVTELDGSFLNPPLAIWEDTRDVTVSDVIARASKSIKGSGESSSPSSPFSYSVTTREKHTEEVCLTIQLISEGSEEAAAGRGVVVTAGTVARSGVCGLSNIGNTCYMNSALQCISALRRFREDVLSFPVSQYPTASITSAYARLLSDMWSGQYDYANTRELKEVLGEKERRFAGFQQQDANELIEVMLDRMEEEVNQVSGRCYRERLDSDKDVPLAQLSQIFWDNFLDNNTGFIPRDFFHQSKTLFRCLTCGETSTVFDNNLTLSLNIKEVRAKKAVRAMVLVTRPSAAPTVVGGCGDHGSASVSPLRDCIRVTLSVRVAESTDGVVSEEDLVEALRLGLIKNTELRDKVLLHADDKASGHSVSRSGGDAEEEEGSGDTTHVELDYTVGVMEVPEYGSAYAYARCYVKASRPSAPATTLSTASVALVPSQPGYRIWYFLKEDNYGSPTAFGSLAYVEEIRHEAAVAEGVEEESAAAAAPLSKLITSRGKRLAEGLLRPVSDDPAVASEEAVAFGTDYMMVPSAAKSATGSAADAPKRLVLKVMHRTSARAPLVDVTKASKKDGDAWLLACRHDADPAVGVPLGPIGPGLDEEARATQEHPATTNVAIFLMYDGREFDKEEVLSVGESDGYRSGWGDGYGKFGRGGGGMVSSNSSSGAGGGDEEEGSACTLEECLHRSMVTDTLAGDDAWYCPRCKTFRETCVQRGLFRLPPCLVISFKRFKMVNSLHADKNNTTVRFPESIDFSQFLDEVARSAPGLNPETKYTLRGVVYHSGSLSFGHYTASVYSDHLRKWVYCNDTNTRVEHGAVPSPEGAYILCYEQVRPSTQLAEESGPAK